MPEFFFGELWRGLKPLCGSRPFFNTDYRAFARWPSYFALAWRDLRESVGTAEHEASLDEVIQMCRLFQWLLPGLITNVAFLRHQLGAV